MEKPPKKPKSRCENHVKIDTIYKEGIQYLHMNVTCCNLLVATGPTELNFEWEDRTMTDRTRMLREKLFDEYKPRICPERCVIFTESMKKSEGRPIALRRSQAFWDVLDKMTVYVNEGELIVGNQAQWPKSSPIYPEYSTQWLREELVEGKPFFPDQRPGDKFYFEQKDVDAIMQCVDYWEGKSLYCCTAN